VACKPSSVCGGSSRAPLTVGPHYGHASRSTNTSQTADDGAAISRSTLSMMLQIPASPSLHTAGERLTADFLALITLSFQHHHCACIYWDGAAGPNWFLTF
jgi:hypothetical protein